MWVIKNKVLKNQFLKRGFARDFKIRLLGEGCCLVNPDFDDVDDAFTAAYNLKNVKDSKYKFLEQSGFSKWWLGKCFPSKVHKDAIELVFPDLFNKWFNLERVTSRFELHLTSIDIFSSAGMCSCKNRKVKEYDFEENCKICSLTAITGANEVLHRIHEDWRPTITGYNNILDLCISGPKKRSGVNIAKNRFFDEVAIESEYSDRPEPDLREKVNYNLDLVETSFVGLPIPPKIYDAYQEDNLFSVCDFLFLLIGLNLKCNVEYKNDLILDFLTALNCAALILFKKHGTINNHTSEIRNRIRLLFSDFQEYFFAIGEKSLKDKLSEKDPVFQREVINILNNDISYQLSDKYISFLSEVLGLNEDETFKYLKEHSHLINNTGKRGEYHQFSNIYQSFSEFKERYFKIMEITGLPEEKIKRTFKKMLKYPFSSSILPNSEEWQKPSPYENDN